MPDEFLTTFQVARICGVSATTVVRWCNSAGFMGPRSFRIPGREGRGNRKIHKQDLESFLGKSDMTIETMDNFNNPPMKGLAR